jgi:hypothetical protein
LLYYLFTLFSCLGSQVSRCSTLSHFVYCILDYYDYYYLALIPPAAFASASCRSGFGMIFGAALGVGISCLTGSLSS